LLHVGVQERLRRESVPDGSRALIERLAFVRLEVGDIERSMAFYRDGLRFQFVGSDDGPEPRVRLLAGDLSVVLSPGPARPRSRGHGVLISLEVVGVDAYRDALVARGVAATVPVDRDGARSFSVRDPDGYTWRFHQSNG
jgi:uncharacterized glyoxalase superfamily protein PhnB